MVKRKLHSPQWQELNFYTLLPMIKKNKQRNYISTKTQILFLNYSWFSFLITSWPVIHLTFMNNKSPCMIVCAVWGFWASSDVVNKFRFQIVFLPSSSCLHRPERSDHEARSVCRHVEIMHSVLLAELVWASVSVTASPTHSHSQRSLWCTATPACLPRHSGKW